MLGTSEGMEEQAPLIFEVDDGSLMAGSEFSEVNSLLKRAHWAAPSIKWILDPKKLPFRVVVLTLICGSTVGSFFSFNSTAAIATNLIEELKISQADYGLLYSVYSIPNLVVPLFGGLLVDRLGVRVGLILYLGLIAAGTGIVAIAPYFERPFAWMLFGRFVFGLGSESSYVAQDTLCVMWFRGRSLAFAMGVMGAFERGAEVFTFYALTNYANHSALWLTAIVCCASLVCGIVVSMMDKYASIKVKEHCDSDEAAAERVRFSDIKNLPLSYWLICVVMLTFYSSVFPFLSFGSDILQLQHGYTAEEAGQVMGLLSFIAIFLSPIFGIAIDAIGKRIYLVNLGNFLLVVAFLLMAYTSINPIAPVVLIGIAYSLIPGALWPALPIIVDEKLFGTASGISLSMSNIGMIPTFYLLGFLIDQFHSVEKPLLLLAGVSLVGLLVGVFWHCRDCKDGSPCNSVFVENLETVVCDEEAAQ